ncbi:MAG: type II toxin-antitoxin system HipA family toxin [Solirubrobacteraceae bacterium]
MTDSLLVILDDSVAGTLTRLRGGRLRFDYDPGYQQRPGRTPLSLSMPVQVASHADRVITPWLWGLLPDNDAVLRRWARDFHVSAASPFSLLSTPIGEDCAGAVRFAAPDEVDRVLGRPGDVAWLSDDDVGERLRELREDATAWLGRSFTGQFSLAGAQAKTALLCKDGRWGVPSGAPPTTHMLKPAVIGLDDHDLNEHLCLDAARRAGLLVARTTLTRFGEETAVVVARYDRRTSPGGNIARVHQEDLCQALGEPPSRKYQNEGGPRPAQIARLLRNAMPPTVAEDAVRRFADALIWNWLIGGTDAHAKNYSLLLAAEQVRIAPLYDVASALPYGVHERKLRFAMKIGSSYDVFPHRNTWPGAARDLGLDADALVERARELAVVGPDAFAAAVNSPDVVALDRGLPGVLLDLVADRAARCRKLLQDSERSETV